MEALNQNQFRSITEAVNVEGLTERVDLYRVDACRKLDSERRSKMGQFFTPSRRFEPGLARVRKGINTNPANR